MAGAQHSPEVLVDIAPCIDVDSVLERLACYDKLARNARNGSQSQASAPEGLAQRDRAGAANEASSGLPSLNGESNRDEVDEITSEVAALREIVPGQLEITLTNGQIWRQTNSDRYRLRIGYPVRIYPTRFGQYFRLTSATLRGFVQVKRVR